MLGLDRELLANLPDQARFRRLVWLALAAGKFPGPFEVRPLQPPRQQKAPSRLDDCGSDDRIRSPESGPSVAFAPSCLRAL